ncbi:uncharacterized protein LOC132467554 [Gadus macrocephalus]|uniref:uncharacterized protein LOC132467554 n=1 Tax=Gadus macrocephalus TaxID=80720 RepID=UPI0028CB3A25|nr:uncharacterized protein LOC132467554 [Gadus macrocephalus]
MEEKWYSSLDLRSGCWQVELAPEARTKRAFTISQGLWQFRVVHFGLCNASTTFPHQRRGTGGSPVAGGGRGAIWDRLGLHPEEHRRRFRPLSFAEEDRPFAYAQQLRDQARKWLVPDRNTPEGVVELITLESTTAREPIGRCRPRGEPPAPPSDGPATTYTGPVHRHSCPAVGQAEPGAEGEMGGQSGHVNRLPPPLQTGAQTAGEGCWWCGRPGHFRQECPMMEVGQVVSVTGAPSPPHGPGEAYSVPTDMSDRGLGAVLTQQVEGADRPVLYLSRKLSDREGRYSTVEKECLAI